MSANSHKRTLGRALEVREFSRTGYAGTSSLPYNGTGVSGVPPDRRYRSPPSPFGDQNEDTEPESVATVPARGRSGEIEASSTPSEDFTWGIPVDSSGERELTPESFPIPEKADQKQKKTSPEIVARCC